MNASPTTHPGPHLMGKLIPEKLCCATYTSINWLASAKKSKKAGICPLLKVVDNVQNVLVKFHGAHLRNQLCVPRTFQPE